jgi:hypothetical protein
MPIFRGDFVTPFQFYNRPGIVLLAQEHLEAFIKTMLKHNLKRQIPHNHKPYQMFDHFEIIQEILCEFTLPVISQEPQARFELICGDIQVLPAVFALFERVPNLF